MDPFPIPGDRITDRIPRTRGDGPRKDCFVHLPCGDSPHARGWTVAATLLDFRVGGFPARAGMDLLRGQGESCGGGIPRTRGDGPEIHTELEGEYKDSPHARGWTLLARLLDRDDAGFPARAGMDPRPPSRTPPSAWIPRTRGDGPHRRPACRARTRDSPHARGWTRGRRTRAASRCGFPARAGMDPRLRGAEAGLRGIPRTRGDGPLSRSGSLAARSDSPHARGWTPFARVTTRATIGFPARAGMDPSARAWTLPVRWIPRTRGDGPAGWKCPACSQRDSPHARGWTQPPRQPRPPHRGFPARAGMDPVEDARPAGRRRIPRTRGDGPDGR